jgi:hypothetical protein
MFMLLQGKFYHAYDAAAFALHRLTGYKVMEMTDREHADVGRYYRLGFGDRQIDDIVKKIESGGGTVKRYDKEGALFSFSGIDGSIDEKMVSPKKKNAVKEKIGDGGIGSAGMAGLSRLIDCLADGYVLEVSLRKRG